MNGGFPDISWFIPASTMFRTCILVVTPKELGSYISVRVTDASGSLSPILLHQGLFIVFGNNEDQVPLVVLGILCGIDGRGDLGNLESLAETDGL